MAVDRDTVLDRFKIVGHKTGASMRIEDAISEDPKLDLTIDGASTLTVVVADHQRELLHSPVIDQRAWAKAAGIHFELVGLAKSGDYLTLTFEDAIVAELRRHTKALTIKPGTSTRAGIVARLAREARIPYRVDPTHPGKVNGTIQRSADGQKSTSWDVLGADVAEPIQWRRFSDGDRLVVGSDKWLAESYKKPVTLREHTGGVQDINFDADVAKRAQTATAEIDTRLLEFRPGAPVRFTQLGPGDGLWIVQDIRQGLTRVRADVTFTRREKALKEPPPESTNAGRDSGDPGYVPGAAGAAGTSKAANAAREKMVSWALNQKGKPYAWGASGPNAFDCSGLVQKAVAAAGGSLPKPSASQWSACQRAGRTISVAEGLRTRGALMFRIGTGATNHVAISLGNGSTIEAKGRAHGVGVFGNADGQGYTGAALWL